MSNTSHHYQRVRAFMKRAQQATPDQATFPDAATRVLRARLMLEEVMETIEALGVTVAKDGTKIEYKDLTTTADTNIDSETPTQLAERFIEIIDGAGDTMVVTLGTLIALGIPDCPVMDEICDSNDSKFRDGYTFDQFGKLKKSPLYTPADLREAIKQTVQE